MKIENMNHIDIRVFVGSVRLLKRNQYVDAIKIVHKIRGMPDYGLKDSKKYVDALFHRADKADECGVIRTIRTLTKEASELYETLKKNESMYFI